MAAPALRVSGLRVVHGSRPRGFELAVDSLALRPGEVLAVLGPNGAGKSTLLRAMAGLLPLRTGRIQGVPTAEVAMVFQRPVMLRGSVAYNVTVPLWGSAMSRSQRGTRVGRALSHFGIEALARRTASTLSGGEMRRVALAQALVREPRVLLLDEPFDDLDTSAQESLTFDLRQVIRETGAALALVTHDLRHAVLLADRIAILVGGRLVQCDTQEEVLRRPRTVEAARLIGMDNLFPARPLGRDEDGTLRLEVAPDHQLRSRSPLPPGGAVWVGVRPERVKLDVGRGETPLVGKGVVRRVISDGILVTLWVAWAGVELRTVMIADRGLGQRIREGDVVSLAIRPEDVHLLPGPDRPAGEPGGW